MNIHHHAERKPAVTPYSLKDAPSFIEAQFPVGRISAEAYKERMAKQGQTLTSLGAYWKGRKPLILVRATLLGCLLPATVDPVNDLRVFLLLMGMDDSSFAQRIKSIKPSDIATDFDLYGDLVDINAAGRARWRETLKRDERDTLIAQWLSTLPYDSRLSYTHRPEEVGDLIIGAPAWRIINEHLGTSAKSMAELIEQLGIMRYGHRPRVADTFCGGGSIPFEAARMGCDVYASDLNPIACMLTWGGFNIIGSAPEDRTIIQVEQRRVSDLVAAEIDRLGIERNSSGNKAKAYLYCLETKCPKTGWMVPMAPSWVISKQKNVIAKLVPNEASKTYDIIVESGVDAASMASAERGTIVGGCLVHPMNPNRDGVAVKVIRGDFRSEGLNGNGLRMWEKEDYKPLPDDVFQERLYCIQWIRNPRVDGGRQETFFAGVTEEDLVRENQVDAIVGENLARWQSAGLVPEMKIQRGGKTDEPIRTRGWTYWHHLYTARQLLFFAEFNKVASSPLMNIILARMLDRSSKLNTWIPSASRADAPANVFANQALNTYYTYGSYAAYNMLTFIDEDRRYSHIGTIGVVNSHPASDILFNADIFVTDPPYADAVNYHEITEFFIAWLSRRPHPPFDKWTWDSQRPIAIKGSDEKFRSDMIAAYRAMANHMPDDGQQVVMFTHQDAGVWADLAAIMWAAGLRVSAAWNIVTETESALREGNYVQGTILLVLRKRVLSGNIKRMDIEGEIEEAVDHQLSSLNALDEDWTFERLYTDGDLQLAAYAAALRVITTYATIDRKEVGADVYRKLEKGEKTVIRELIEYAASVANNKLVPDGFPPAMWRDLDAPSRFYVRMLDMESKGTTKFADYQDFARTFSVADYADLMDSTKANAASLAGAGALKARMLGGKGFGTSPLRRVLFATHKTMQKDDPREGLAFLKTELGQDYWPNRAKLVALAKYVSTKTTRTRPVESSAADLLGQRLEVDKV
ncbi:anti-phage-associated DUF1156 domain-containing protein [Methylobacterium sp. 77]|uniref:anti-phage-associated DUF1156 domain-containing protein n=1 Tax=Methylobacterium sp. 77 TaxID=1101192 RepID=UPI0018CBC4DE|nr:anti-phage-associated DUF1156 domain-containing protein [Methylobacterium sp. 77]